jgi:hypothetical protein
LTPQNNSDLIAIMRDGFARLDANHKELHNELKEVKQSLDARLDAVEKTVDKHDHVLQTGFTAIKWIAPSGGLAAVAAWLISITNGQAK